MYVLERRLTWISELPRGTYWVKKIPAMKSLWNCFESFMLYFLGFDNGC